MIKDISRITHGVGHCLAEAWKSKDGSDIDSLEHTDGYRVDFEGWGRIKCTVRTILGAGENRTGVSNSRRGNSGGYIGLGGTEAGRVPGVM